MMENTEDAFPGGPACAVCQFPRSRGVPQTGEVQGWAAGFPPSGGHRHARQVKRDFPTKLPATRPDGQVCVFSSPRGDGTCPRHLQAGLTGSDGHRDGRGTFTSRAKGTFVTGSVPLGGHVCAPARACACVSVHTRACACVRP